MKKPWKILLLVGLIVVALLITRQIVKASTTTSDTDDATTTDGNSATDAQKVLGSATTAAFPSGSKLYANTNLNVRKAAGVTNTILKVAEVGSYIGTTTGTETKVDTTTWVEVKLSDGSKAYVSKNFTYILR